MIGQPMIQLSYASSDLSATQALSMKCIILQNDKDSGCGLVITGERPVIVNKVTEGNWILGFVFKFSKKKSFFFLKNPKFP